MNLALIGDIDVTYFDLSTGNLSLCLGRSNVEDQHFYNISKIDKKEYLDRKSLYID